MRVDQLGGVTVRITGGDDREGGGSGPVLVLMHGFGAPGTDLVPMWRQIRAPRGTRFVFPEAPLDLSEALGQGMVDARAWWLIDMERLQAAQRSGEERNLTRGVPEGMPEARALVVAMLDELEKKLSVSSDRIVVGGFSQGAMLACDVALRTDRPFAGLVLMSGTLVAAEEWTAKMPARRGLSVLQSHGRSDPILPFSLAERLRDELRGAGLDVTWVEFQGGHGISDGVVDALGTFLGRVVPEA